MSQRVTSEVREIRPHSRERESPSDDESIVELLGDSFARTILAALKAGPKTARELVAICEGSRPTVYRRLSSLEERDLVTASVRIDPNGHHRKEYSTALDSVVVNVEPDAFETRFVTDDGE